MLISAYYVLAPVFYSLNLHHNPIDQVISLAPI